MRAIADLWEWLVEAKTGDKGNASGRRAEGRSGMGPEVGSEQSDVGFVLPVAANQVSLQKADVSGAEVRAVRYSFRYGSQKTPRRCSSDG
jgi:hypothetical protein